MLILISPAKTLDFDVPDLQVPSTQPEFLDEAQLLVDKLKKYNPSKLQQLMRINPKLADLNAKRYMDWHQPFTEENAKPAILVFKGEVFTGLKAEELSADDLEFSQDHLRILSGLYGVMRPLDLIQPYRLEMGTKLKTRKGEDLYQFWGSKITESIGRALKEAGQNLIINLASNEYFNSIDKAKLGADIITPTFKDFSKGQYKFITVYGKRARGMMARFIIRNRIVETDRLKLFDEDGYYYNDKMSNDKNLVFTRG
jgi:cytoplasmic iron level regulating protein YaaA (DUF328/UPF0246 family)